MEEVTIGEDSSSTRQPRLVVHPVNRWHGDHSNFARLLDLLEQQIDSMHQGGWPDYELMRLIVYYLRHNPDHFHHPREDVAFARMVERDPQLQLEIARRMQEHVVIAAAGEKLLDCLNQIIAGAAIERSELEAAAATYLVYYRHHLAAEEREVIPRAMQLLTSADWTAVAAIPAEPDPVFGDGTDARYSELRKRIAEEPKQTP
jgi:hemerythrin-like domain-containing protein